MRLVQRTLTHFGSPGSSPGVVLDFFFSLRETDDATQLLLEGSGARVTGPGRWLARVLAGMLVRGNNVIDQ